VKRFKVFNELLALLVPCRNLRRSLVSTSAFNCRQGRPRLRSIGNIILARFRFEVFVCSLDETYSMIACVRCKFITNVSLESSELLVFQAGTSVACANVNGIRLNAIFSFHFFADNAIAELVRGVTPALWSDYIAASEPRPVRNLWPERLWAQPEL
jgi:hypothetical protein